MTNCVIISHGRLRLLQQAIESLYRNTDPKQFNLVVVSDGETDFRCSRYLRSLAHKNFSLLEVANSGHVLAQLKNLGIFWSRQKFGAGEWLYISDADVAFLPDWLPQLTMVAESAEFMGFRLIGGQVHPFHQKLAPSTTVDIESRLGFTEHSVLDGPSWLMRWKTWRDVGPFSRTCAPGVCQSEDAEWCSRLTTPKNGGSYRDAERNRGGYRIGVIQPHVVIHAGLTNSNGEDAPGRKEREAMIPAGVIAE